MLKRIMTRSIGAGGRHLTRLAGDRRGVAAVEFGYLAPIMLIMLVGTFEVARAINMDRRFGLVTSMTGDLIAREKTINDSQLNAIMDSIGHVMKPYDDATLKLGVISVKAMSNPSDTRVEWSYAHNGATVPAKCSTYTLPTGLVAAGASVIIVETTYQYEPVIAGFDYKGLKFASATWTDKSTHSPRNSCVDYNGTNCVLSCS